MARPKRSTRSGRRVGRVGRLPLEGRDIGDRRVGWMAPCGSAVARKPSKRNAQDAQRRSPAMAPDEKQPEHMDGELAASVHYSNHDLREMFSRENAERRRTGGKMLRARLTAAQDKKCMAQMVKIRDQYEANNSDDIVLKWIQLQVEAGKADDIDEGLMELANKVEIPERDPPWDDEAGR